MTDKNLCDKIIIMNDLSIIPFLPFFIISLIHLISSCTSKTRLYNVTKIFLMPSLVFAILFSLRNDAKQDTVIYLTAALLAGTAGDIFLIRPVTKKKFIKGVFSFFAGHIFYLLILIPRSKFWMLPAWIVVPLITAYLLVLFGLYSLLQKPKGLRGFAAVVYAFMLLLINFVCITAVFTWIFYRDSQESSIIPLVVTAAGNIVFLISDSILAFTMFKKDFKYSKFFVQLTYIAAQFLLVTGILSGI